MGFLNRNRAALGEASLYPRTRYVTIVPGVVAATAHVATVDVLGRVWLLECEDSGTGIYLAHKGEERGGGGSSGGDDCADEIYFGWGEAGLIVGCRMIDTTQSSPRQRKLGRDLKGIVATQIPGTGTSTVDSG